MAEESVGDVKLRDPLSEVTRKERKFLLGISIIAITLVKAGIVPTKLSALGVEFGKTDQQSLLWVLGLITLYFLIAFIVYASSDFLAWRLAFRQALRRSLKERWDAELQGDESYKRLREYEQEFRMGIGNRVVFILSGPVSFIRALFEFILPIVIGIYTIILVWTKDLPNITS
jgi:hypothetical protein